MSSHIMSYPIADFYKPSFVYMMTFLINKRSYPSPAAVLGLGHVLGHWVAFFKANRHRIPNSHFCRGQKKSFNKSYARGRGTYCQNHTDVSKGLTKKQWINLTYRNRTRRETLTV